MSKPICPDCVAGVQLLCGVETYLPGLSCRGAAVMWCRNLSAGTELQGCSCLSGVETNLLGLCCRDAAVQVVSKPICRDCVAEVQLFKQCRNRSAGTVLQGCSCLSGVETYLPGLCCMGAAV